ncbi:AbiEi antitoxin N-terminal domain-containing protein [Halovibrio sp. HP20-50]|uniref:AbiEi antitoxin N-terminal domain-containing protein n=1 Tax=Halovibrio sp. HP20-59 TaxID=3080275 RepID=UPI00294AA221|nr:AbiEi antitoxin N-terminal domain-containing protein [Halovibrio sp. HP20-59]MEA2118982.1 AbiEi antitoxin N-terminal domain-containing protein [Halovibrio sp. HP20-59]
MVDTAWLERCGVSRFLTRKYVDSGWLERVNTAASSDAPRLMQQRRPPSIGKPACSPCSI